MALGTAPEPRPLTLVPLTGVLPEGPIATERGRSMRVVVTQAACLGPAPGVHPTPVAASHHADSVGAMIDLHTHSTISDGTDTPRRVVELAAEAGCSAVALTDHDSFAGLAEARAAADAAGIRLVPGCEVSCLPSPAGGGVHVLVYFVDDPSGPLGLELAALRNDRAGRNQALLERLHELGVPITWEQVLANAGSEAGVGRPHFANAMVDAGVVATASEAFDTWLGNDGKAYIPKARLTVGDVARLARASGGVASLAHPFTTRLEGRALADWVAEQAEAGLVGLECYYGASSPEDRRAMVDLARRLGLVPTGGSDYHGARKQVAVGTGNGSLKVPNSVLDELEAALL